MPSVLNTWHTKLFPEPIPPVIAITFVELFVTSLYACGMKSSVPRVGLPGADLKAAAITWLWQGRIYEAIDGEKVPFFRK